MRTLKQSEELKLRTTARLQSFTYHLLCCSSSIELTVVVVVVVVAVAVVVVVSLEIKLLCMLCIFSLLINGERRHKQANQM